MKVITPRKGKDKQQKKVPPHPSISSIKKCKKSDKNRTWFNMKIIAYKFGDGWPKFIKSLFVGQKVEALF